MNRRERRAAAAHEDPPPEYVRTVQLMVVALRRWLKEHPDDPPHFALPPAHVHMAVCIDQVRHVLARDAAARELVDVFCAIGVQCGGPGGEPTVTMVWAVLDLVGVKADVVPTEAFGPYKLISRDSREVH